MDQKKSLNLIASVLILGLVFGIGYGVGSQKIRLEGSNITIQRGNVPTNGDYSLLWETLDLLNRKYVDRPLDQQELLYGAVAGLVRAVGDPYTVFLDPKEAKEFDEELSGSFNGIGAEIGIKNDQLVVIAPLEGTPAAKAGLLPGDGILAINGEPTNGLTVDQAVSKIRGPAGSEVTLSILHKDERQPEEKIIQRARIEIKSLKFETNEIDGKKIGIIKLNRFGDDTKGLFDHVVDVVMAGNYDGLIVDLRNNPGGYLETSIEIASNWVDSGKVVVKEVRFNDEEKSYPSSGLARLKELKTVVLINGGSASAAEILAGALQDHKKATLVGDKTFGKGSVQELNLMKDGSDLKITTGKWRTPKGRDINKNGLEPDIKVEMTREDIEADRDPQMDKALELLR